MSSYLSRGSLFSTFGITLAIGLAVRLETASAGHIDPPSIGLFRTAISPTEGYLEYKTNPASSRFGEEWTGWMDVRHPVMDGTSNVFVPFDRSNRTIQVRPTTLTDSNGIAAAPNLTRDFDFANKVYAQAGVSVTATGARAYTSGANPPNPAANFSFPLSHGRGVAQAGLPDEELDIRNKLAGAGNVVEAYYAGPPMGGGSALVSGANAEAYSPGFDGSPGIFFDAGQYQNSTFSHEVGHVVMDHGPGFAGGGHSADPQNFMFATGSNYTLDSIGATAGKMDDAQIDRLFSNPGGAGHQYVQGIAEDANFHRYGNKVDWDFVTDQANLEARANGADSHAGLDSLFFEIGNSVAPANQNGHDHTGLDNFANLGSFAGPTFRTADVFSLSTRYSDFDRDGGTLSLKEGALDYEVFFRAADGTMAAGTAFGMFDFGWTATTNADNFLVRWVSPIAATGMFIFGKSSDGHDGNAQIDAVIVSAAAVPEPGGLVLCATGVLVICGVSIQKFWRNSRCRPI